MSLGPTTKTTGTVLDTFNSLPDKVKLALLYKHNQEFREALQEKVWNILHPECSRVLCSCAHRT